MEEMETSLSLKLEEKLSLIVSSSSGERDEVNLFQCQALTQFFKTESLVSALNNEWFNPTPRITFSKLRPSRWRFNATPCGTGVCSMGRERARQQEGLGDFGPIVRIKEQRVTPDWVLMPKRHQIFRGSTRRSIYSYVEP
jgi:hypothetical protein